MHISLYIENAFCQGRTEYIWGYIRTLDIRLQVCIDEGEIRDFEFKAKKYSCIC